MKKSLALLLIPFLLLGEGCVSSKSTGPAGAVAAIVSVPAFSEASKPASAQTAAATSTPEPTPTAAPNQKTNAAALWGTWRMTQMLNGDSVVDRKALGIESILAFSTNGEALYYWHEKTVTERQVMSFTIQGDTVVLLYDEDNLLAAYDGESDTLRLFWETAIQVYERDSDAVIPAIDPPAVESEEADGVYGVWILTELETDREESEAYVRWRNHQLLQDRYALRLQFKRSLSGIEYSFDGSMEYSRVFRYTVDSEAQTIRFSDPAYSIPFRLEGNTLILDDDGICMHFVRFRRTAPV